MARELVDQDDFTGAAGPIAAGWSVWRGQNLELDGSGNALLSPNSTTGGSYRNAGAYNTNQYCEVTMTAASDGAAGQNVDVGVRAQSAANAYLCIIRTTGVDLYKVVADVFNLLSTIAGAQTWAANDKWSIEVADNGSSQPVFKIFKNAAQVGSDFTDTGASPFAGGRPVVCLRQDSAPATKITNWEGGSVTTGAATVQNGAASVVITANASQSYAPASSTNTTQQGGAGVVVTASARQGFNIRANTSSNVLAHIFGAQAGTPWINQAGITWQWQDAWGGPVVHSGTDTTDGTGLFSVRVPATALDNGQGGRLCIELPDANPPLTWPRQILYLTVSYG